MQVKGIIAKSFGRQFYRNAINNGLPILECDISQIKDGEELSVDFSRGEIRTAGGALLQAKALPAEILSLIEAGGLIAFLKDNPDWNFAQ
jgi:3-isopropylmalate dehydratase small subunit